MRAWLRSNWQDITAYVVAAVGFVLLAIGMRKRLPAPPTPAQRRKAERDNEILHSAIEESVGVADIAQARANTAGARATYFGGAAGDAKQRLRDMSEADRQAAVKRAKERLRRGGLRLVTLALLTAGTARADEPLTHPRTGVEGWWMDHDEKLELDGWVLELDARRMQIGELNAQVGELMTVTTRLRTAVQVSDALLRATEKRLNESDAQVDKLSAWYRSPRFLIPFGFVTGIALTTAIVWAAQ